MTTETSGRKLPAWAVPAALSAFVLLGRLLPLPPLTDFATGKAAVDFALVFPLGYQLFAPFSALADLLTLNALPQHLAWLAWLLLGWWPLRWVLRERGRPVSLAREAGLYALWLILVAAFLAWATLAPRPMARLRAADPEVLLFDMHSHSARSWDGRRSFGPKENMEWHRAAGYSASFLTDHNRAEGSAEAKALSGAGLRSLYGVELSLDDAHVVVLGPRTEPRQKDYEDGQAGLARLLKDCGPKYGALCVMSLPEYRRRRWEERERRVDQGAGGFELLNGTPKGLAFSASDRAAVLELSRRRNLPVFAASDDHGFSRAAPAWNAARLNGHGLLGADALERSLLALLKKEGFGATRVIARARREPSPLALPLEPPLALWTLVRTLAPLQTAVTLLWLWAAWLALAGARRRS
ncbi:MAG: hypothetical protein WC969_14405 [Elusimicrobiota bacterium]|jgi:hypothetical protein